MDKEYVKLKTLANQPVVYEGLTIRPKTLNEIIDLGYDQFNQKLRLISLKKEDVFAGVDFSEYNYPLIFFLLHTDGSDLIVEYLTSFSFFLGEEVSLSASQDSLVIAENQYPFETLDQLAEIIKTQNSYVSENDDDFNPLNDRVRALREKMLARKNRLRELKQDQQSENGLSLQDLISILCSNANGINIFNVFNLNFFQFNDQFNRMRMIDEYEVNIQALLHGADSKNIKLTHWISGVK
ncbi:hypothetical protein [Paenibacillus silvae]|uniref:Uncharacterized protein n=1 Tax=Paenibacillus silvae TaxID=1325358 RepID=A0A2W6NNZ3_9BACL|nr:hypothetical protein [Paenibacillus silvae]PZT57495.1 hypothetical protein DN757_02235 [Paenibacillus silvae]